MSTDSVPATVSDRLTQVFDHLGIERAHVGSAPIGDLAALISERPDSVSSVTLVNPTRLTADVLAPFADRLIMFTGDQGPAAESITAAMRSLESVELHVAEAQPPAAAPLPDASATSIAAGASSWILPPR